MERIRVFVVDDSAVARQMLIRLLSTESDIEVVGEAGTGQGSIIMLEEVNPDIVLLEVDIGGGMDVNDVILELKQINPDVKIILCADSKSSQQIIPATEIGAYDFVMKPYKKPNILRVIREAMGAV